MLNLLSNKLFRFVLIPFLLILVWFFASLLFSSYRSLTVLIYPHASKSYINFPSDGQLAAGNKITGKFQARENNLGIVALKIQRVNWRTEEEVLAFKIKEEKDKEWTYKQSYKSGMLGGSTLFTFGFPVMDDSKGKTIEFEVELVNDLEDAEIIFDKSDPAFYSRYKFSKSDVLTPDSFSAFAIKRMYTFFINPDVLISTSIFLIPLEIYFLWIFLSAFNKKVNKKNTKILGISIFLILNDILLIKSDIPAVFFLFFILWILAIRKSNLQPKHSLYFSFASIITGVAFSYFGNSGVMYKASLWAYAFLIAGGVQALISKNDNVRR